jgi:catechol-2,3-dioxygenase
MPRVAEIALFTSDVEGLTSFYERLLGKAPDSSSPSHASFEVGDTTVFIHIAGEKAHGDVPNADHIAFVLDQDEAAKRARSAGAEVAGPRDYYWGRSAYLRDPDGRMIELQDER